VEPSTITTEQEVCEQHFITHTTQQDDGRFVVRLPTKMDPKQLGSSRLTSKRRLHAFERRLEQELEDQYHNFMRKSKGHDHRDAVNSREGKKHATVYQSSSLKEISCTTKLGLLWNPTIDKFQVMNKTTQVQPKTPQRVQNERC